MHQRPVNRQMSLQDVTAGASACAPAPGDGAAVRLALHVLLLDDDLLRLSLHVLHICAAGSSSAATAWLRASQTGSIDDLLARIRCSGIEQRDVRQGSSRGGAWTYVTPGCGDIITTPAAPLCECQEQHAVRDQVERADRL